MTGKTSNSRSGTGPAAVILSNLEVSSKSGPLDVFKKRRPVTVCSKLLEIQRNRLSEDAHLFQEDPANEERDS